MFGVQLLKAYGQDVHVDIVVMLLWTNHLKFHSIHRGYLTF